MQIAVEIKTREDVYEGPPVMIGVRNDDREARLRVKIVNGEDEISETLEVGEAIVRLGSKLTLRKSGNPGDGRVAATVWLESISN